MSVKNHKDAELEQIAEDFLKAKGTGKCDNRSLRIDALIESIGYYIFSVPGLGEIAEAYIPAKPGYIFVDEDQYLNGNSFRWRFTLAEELAHVLIHYPMFKSKNAKEIVAIQEKLSDDDYKIMEKNAKFLAGCLLMPKDIFKDRFKHFYTIQGQRMSNTLNVLKFAVKQLSIDFNISCYAVSLRALQIGLIDQQQMDDLNY